jgi:cyclic pyranopterin phosphate synthase
MAKHIQGMVDITDKEITRRVARAQAVLHMQPETLQAVIKDEVPKGSVFEGAKMAGLLAAKATPSILPYCHPIELTKVSFNFAVDEDNSFIRIETEVICIERTGAEMEALQAVSAAAMMMYDMLKYKEKGMRVTDICVLSKSGGKSGDYIRGDA